MNKVTVAVPQSVVEETIAQGDVSILKEWWENQQGNLSSDEEKVYEAWLELFFRDRKMKPAFLPERRTIARARLRRFSADQLIQAMRAVAGSTFMMGDNSSARRYVDFRNMMSNDAKVEQWLDHSVDQNTEKAAKSEQHEQLRLKLKKAASNLRNSPSPTLQQRERLLDLLLELKDYGETFDWRTGEFEGHDEDGRS